MKRNLTAPSNDGPAIETSLEFDAAMDQLTELFSDPSMPVPPDDFRCSTEGPTDIDVMMVSIIGDEYREYKRWIIRLYGLGLIPQIPSEWKASEMPDEKSSACPPTKKWRT